MTKATIFPLGPARKLVSLLPDTDLSRLLAETFALAAAEPQVLAMIDRDRDAAALQKKQARCENAAWYAARGMRASQLMQRTTSARPCKSTTASLPAAW